MGSIRRLVTVLGSGVLILGTLTLSVAATTSITAASGATKFKACVVTDTGGINDKSFNESAWNGALEAYAADPSMAKPIYLQSESSADYTPNIKTFEGEGCGIIITVGYDMDAATAAAADASPNQKFAIVDDSPTAPKTHELLSLRYQTNQAAFLGGYFAAATSTTGVVATYGGQDIPTVTIYMSGFVAGVRYYDQVNKKDVKVTGFTPAKGTCTLATCGGTGTFTNNFTDQTEGKTIATGDFAAGADIVFPVAGSVGLGSVAAAIQAGKGHQILWVDSNGCESDASQCKWFDGTVFKGVEPSVDSAILAAARGTFKGGTYIGTLANNGTGLEYNTTNASAALKAKIASIKAGIIAGTISVNPNKYPVG
jgi:basic membrane protein A